MKAIVCVKQVPDTQGKVAVKADGTMDRSAMATITNPDDLNAVEAALQLKDETGCEVVVVTMGPPPAEGMLRELMARGGPLELGDFVGLDICLAIMDVLYKETGDSKYRACPLIRKMVRGGNLGCKTGKGFYVYNADRTKTPVDAL
jgi:hypothetical protein